MPRSSITFMQSIFSVSDQKPPVNSFCRRFSQLPMDTSFVSTTLSHKGWKVVSGKTTADCVIINGVTVDGVGAEVVDIEGIIVKAADVNGTAVDTRSRHILGGVVNDVAVLNCINTDCTDVDLIIFDKIAFMVVVDDQLDAHDEGLFFLDDEFSS
ncbi:hypothetical protein NDU88_011437 [Pleurodeles waltl]|uniref:Uncharacterized protein n=1 Tax=Pleurodeles waltl TaxID=8319 RepID=A0AAV7R3D2_PLEWA|nr:hypothetical protein NDU88_011437 [Pleurodeles waltl]